MEPIKSLDEATRWLLLWAPERLTETDYRLDRMHRLMQHLGTPQNEYRVVHVAGTSGKTSTCYFIRGLLQAAGKKTGLTVSPHIVAINERVQIDGRPLEETAFLHYVNQFRDHVMQFAGHPSYYELTMALAYWVFAKEQVDYAVIETGLGGLLDSSNVIEREDKLCVINAIGYDHTELLGTTIEAIAAQKAGIIQSGNHCVVIDQAEAALAAIAKRARAKHAVMAVVTPHKIAGLPFFQHGNWALALEAYRYLVKRDEVPELSSNRLADVQRQTPPGRYEVYHIRGKTLILDGAHNPQKLSALNKTLVANGITSATVVCAFKTATMQKVQDDCSAIAGVCGQVILDSFQLGQDSKHIKSTPSRQVETAFRVYGVEKVYTAVSHDDALTHAFATSSPHIVVTGSLYLVSGVRPLVQRLALEAE